MTRRTFNAHTSNRANSQHLGRVGIARAKAGWVLVIATALFVSWLCLTTPEPPTVVQYYEVDQP